MSVVVVATIYPIAEHREEVIAAFAEAAARVHVEDEGCELYALHEGADRLVMIEKWSSPEALASHGSSPALRELGQRIKGKLLSAPDVQVYTPHPAGSAAKGAL